MFAGRLASIDDEVLLVTTSEEAHINCCKLLDNMIVEYRFKDIPKGFDIKQDTLLPLIRSHKLKYLGICISVSITFNSLVKFVSNADTHLQACCKF